MFKSIENFFSEPTVMILGAGASKDYCFPLWDELKPKILAHCIENPFPKQISKDILSEISTLLNEMDESRSIDNVVTEFGEDAFNAYQLLNGLTLIECERDDREANNIGWLDVFASKVSTFLIEIEQSDFELACRYMRNVRFYSLNYDRVFQERFVEPLFNRLKQEFRPGNRRLLNDRRPNGLVQQSNVGVFSVFQPHGVIAQHKNSATMGLNQVSSTDTTNMAHKVVEYGDVDGFKRLVAEGWIPRTRVVDDFDRQDLSSHPTYGHCNSRLKGKRVFLAGLSEKGIVNSRFNFHTTTEVGMNLSTSTILDETRDFISSKVVENEDSCYLKPYFDSLPIRD